MNKQNMLYIGGGTTLVGLMLILSPNSNIKTVGLIAGVVGVGVAFASGTK